MEATQFLQLRRGVYAMIDHGIHSPSHSLAAFVCIVLGTIWGIVLRGEFGPQKAQVVILGVLLCLRGQGGSKVRYWSRKLGKLLQIGSWSTGGRGLPLFRFVSRRCGETTVDRERPTVDSGIIAFFFLFA